MSANISEPGHMTAYTDTNSNVCLLTCPTIWPKNVSVRRVHFIFMILYY